MQEAPNMRAAERIRAFLRAQIIFNNRMSTIDCIIKNISPLGAKIALNDTLAVPTEFDIYIPQKGRGHHARLIWRDKESIGVEFTDVQPAAASAPATAVSAASGPAPGDMMPMSAEARIRELEIQNAELKGRIRALSRRLEDLGQDPGLTG